MIFRLAEINDCQYIAKIHYQEIKQGFLNQLGEKFLCLFYKAMIKSPNAFLIVAENNKHIIGFVSGCINLKKFYKEFVKRYWHKIFLIALNKIRFVKNILEITRYSKKEKNDLPQAELLSIAVDVQFQSQGIAKQLFEKFVLEMKKRNINKFKVIVGSDLSKAIKFYEKNGFQFYSKGFVHKNTPSLIYTYNLNL